jgi:hypothetical protein
MVEGAEWIVTEVAEVDEAPAYTCISYIWGDEKMEREDNPFYPALGPAKISTHTLSSLASAIKAFQSQTPAFWIDAFCIPVYNPSKPETREEKNATLESMGYIYHKATQVAVVLANESYAAIAYMMEKIDPGRRTNPAQVDIPLSISLDPYVGMNCLENDRWISSVWTYQEVMGNGNLRFLSESAGGPPFGFEDCFNAIGIFASKHFDTMETYPRLDAFLTLGGDWMTSATNYALKIMANMDKRYTGEAKNYWYARIGALTTERTMRATKAEDKELAQKFMDVSERLGDYSFIFSAAERESIHDERGDGVPLRRWRPRPGKLPAALPEHNSGAPQKGEQLEDGSLKLEYMTVYPVASQIPGPGIVRWINSLQKESANYLKSIVLSSSELKIHEIGNECFKILQNSGFEGSADYTLVEDGLFFPQNSPLPSGTKSVLVSTVIEYSLGAPALLMHVDNYGIPSYMAGVFMGRVAAERRKGESVFLM